MRSKGEYSTIRWEEEVLAIELRLPFSPPLSQVLCKGFKSMYALVTRDGRVVAKRRDRDLSSECLLLNYKAILAERTI